MDLNANSKLITTYLPKGTGLGIVKLLSDEVNVLRDDKISSEVSQKEALKNAPEKDSDYFKVPTVLKK